MRSQRSQRPLSRAVQALLAAGLLTLAPATLFAQDTGTADFTRYVAMGDSLTAGFMSGGLVDEVQALSYPALIAAQARGSAAGFEQPTVSRPGIPALLQLRSLIGPVITPAAGLGSPTNLFLARPYDNLAVPGADVGDVVNTVTDNGGLHDLILRGLGTQLQQAAALQPTFVSLWIGNNDALAAATSGIVIDDVTLTTLPKFEQAFRAIVGTINAVGANMVIANVPDVTSIPFVTTVAPVLVDPATRQPILVGGNLVPLLGPDGPLTPGQDFVLLTASAQLAQGRGIPVAFGGSGLPLTDDVVLSGAEAAAINGRVAGFNAIIATVAGEVGAATVDINSIFGRIARQGLLLGGIDYETDFLTGGLFSYDGVHATATGYAIVANEFIESINRTYGGSIPKVSLGRFVFGPEGRVGTSIEVGTSLTGSFVYTRAADDNLRFALGVPDRATLRRLKREAGGGEQGGDGGPPVDTRGLPPGHGHYCSEEFPCTFGLGDCDSDSQCADGLRCASNRGADFGFRAAVDVCM